MFLQLGNAYLKKTNRKFTNNCYFQLLHNILILVFTAKNQFVLTNSSERVVSYYIKCFNYNALRHLYIKFEIFYFLFI